MQNQLNRDYTAADRRMQLEVEAAEKRGDKFNLPSLDDKRMQIREDRPQTAQEMKVARLQKETEETTANWQKWLQQIIREKKSIQLSYNAITQTSGVCPFIKNIPVAVQVRDEKVETAAFMTFVNSETFEPWRERNPKNTARFEAQTTILTFLSDFLKVNYFDPGQDIAWGISFVLLHNAGFVPQPLPVPVALPEPEPSAVDQAVVDRQRKIEIIVGTDEYGKNWVEAELNALPAKEELRLRRLFEKGHRGSSLMDQFYEVKDAQRERDAELAKRVLAGN